MYYDFSKCETLDGIMNGIEQDSILEYESDKKLLQLFKGKGICIPYVELLGEKITSTEKWYVKTLYS